MVDKAAAPEAKVGKETHVVHQDIIWRKYVENENRVADEFVNEWGFLTKAGRGKFKDKFYFCWSKSFLTDLY